MWKVEIWFEILACIAFPSVVAVCYGFDIPIPAGSTIPAFVPLVGSGTDGRGGVIGFTLRQHHRRMSESRRCFLPDHMGGGTENQILRKVPVLVEVRFHDAILAGRDPVKGSRSVLCHGADVPKVRHRLNVARVMPSEVFDLLSIEKGDECGGPSGILQGVEPCFQRFLHNWKDIAALEGVASRADGTLDIPQLGSSGAPLRRSRGTVPRHFRRLGQSADDRFEVLHLRRDGDRGILHGDGVSLSDSEVHRGHAFHYTIFRHFRKPSARFTRHFLKILVTLCHHTLYERLIVRA